MSITQGEFWKGLTDHSRGKQDEFAAGYDWDADDSSQSDYYTQFNKTGQDARNSYWGDATKASQGSVWDSGSDWDLSSFNADGIDPDDFRSSVSHSGQGLYNVGDNYWFDRDTDAKFDSDKTFSSESDAWEWMKDQENPTSGKYENISAPWQQQQTAPTNSFMNNPWAMMMNPMAMMNPWMNQMMMNPMMNPWAWANNAQNTQGATGNTRRRSKTTSTNPNAAKAGGVVGEAPTVTPSRTDGGWGEDETLGGFSWDSPDADGWSYWDSGSTDAGQNSGQDGRWLYTPEDGGNGWMYDQATEQWLWPTRSNGHLWFSNDQGEWLHSSKLGGAQPSLDEAMTKQEKQKAFWDDYDANSGISDTDVERELAAEGKEYGPGDPEWEKKREELIASASATIEAEREYFAQNPEADTDEDGRISPEELRAHKVLNNVIDSDREIAVKALAKDKAIAVRAEYFTNNPDADTDEDGMVSEDEVTAHKGLLAAAAAAQAKKEADAKKVADYDAAHEGLIAPDESYEQTPEYDEHGNPTGRLIDADTTLYDWVNENTGKTATVEAGYTAAEGSGWKRLGKSGAGEKEGTPPKVEFTNPTDWWSDGEGGVTTTVADKLYNVLFEVPDANGTLGLARINQKVNLTDEDGSASGTVWRDADHNMWYQPEGGQPMRIDKFVTSLATAEAETLKEKKSDADDEQALRDAAADLQDIRVTAEISFTEIKKNALTTASELLKTTESAAAEGAQKTAGTNLQDKADTAAIAQNLGKQAWLDVQEKDSTKSITAAGAGKGAATGGALGSLLNTSGGNRAAIDSAISKAEQAKIDASDKLSAAEKSYADLYESDILDRLRGAKLRGQRATEFGTGGSTNRLLLQAEAQAAKDAHRLRSGSDLSAAKRELGFAETRAEAQLKNAAEGEMRDLGLNQQYINRNLGNIDQAIDRKLENELKADMASRGLHDDEANLKFQNAITKANGDYAAATTAIMRELGYGEDAINQRLQTSRDARQAELQSLVTRETHKIDAANKMAAVYGSTPEETYGMVTLAEGLVEQGMLEGEIESENEEAIYQAMMQAANLFAKNPSIYELYSNMAAQDMDLADLWKSLEDTLASNRIGNIGAIGGMGQAAIDYDPWMALQNSGLGPAMAQWPYMSAMGFGNQSTIPSTAYGTYGTGMLPTLGLQGAINNTNEGVEDSREWYDKFLNTIPEGFFSTKTDP